MIKKPRRYYCCTAYEMRSDKKMDLQTFLLVITIILILTIGAICIIHIDTVCKQQIDTLDQLNYVRQEFDGQSIKCDVENRSQVNSEPMVNISDSERSLIERIVMSESGDEGLLAQMAVAQTIYDRMNDFSDTLQEAAKTYSRFDNGAPTDSVKLAVVNVFDKGARVYEGGTYQFHDSSVTPYWIEGKVNRGSIVDLRFYGGYK